MRKIAMLLAEVKAANARERKAFMAGVDYGFTESASDDWEQAWQQYRCQDDTDWKATVSTQIKGESTQNVGDDSQQCQHENQMQYGREIECIDCGDKWEEPQI